MPDDIVISHNHIKEWVFRYYRYLYKAYGFNSPLTLGKIETKVTEISGRYFIVTEFIEELRKLRLIEKYDDVQYILKPYYEKLKPKKEKPSTIDEYNITINPEEICNLYYYVWTNNGFAVNGAGD